MRRAEIVNGIDRLASAIKQSGIQQGLRIATLSGERTKPDQVAKGIQALHQFGLLAANFGEAERFIMDAFNLSPLLESDQWAPMLFDPKNDAARVLFRSLALASDFLPKFKSIIEPDYQEAIVTHSPGVPKVLQGKILLTVIAIEERHQFSGPQRLIEVMESVLLFYEALAILADRSADDLIVLTCDSGSDKSFDFLGAAKLMEQVKELILSLWDKVVFFRERKAAERIQLVAKSLPVIEEIARLRESGALIPEKAEIVSRKIMEGVEKFLRNGATIPEIRNASQFNSRALLAPQTKLLMDAPEDAPEGASTENAQLADGETEQPAEDTGLSRSEQVELMNLLEKLKKGGGGLGPSVADNPAENDSPQEE